eukprot:tig00000270_g23913.t1
MALLRCTDSQDVAYNVLVNSDVPPSALEFPWRVDRDRVSKTFGGRKHYLSQLILGKSPRGRYVEHINGNPLDYRRENLRWASMSEIRKKRRGYANLQEKSEEIREMMEAAQALVQLSQSRR